jgi:hypothetical protein
MHGHRANSTYYYRCITRNDSSPGRTCRTYIREDAISDVLNQWLAPPLTDSGKRGADSAIASGALDLKRAEIPAVSITTKPSLNRKDLLDLYTALALRLHYDADTSTLHVEQAVDTSIQST